MFHPYSFYLQKHKNAKSNESLPSHFSASPYYFTSLSIPPMSQTAFYYVPFRHLGYIFGTFAHNVQPRFSVCHLRFRCKIYAFSLSIGKIDLAPFCIFVILCFCILQMRNCFRSAIETSFIALTYSHFCESWSDMTKDTSKIEGGAVEGEVMKEQNEKTGESALWLSPAFFLLLG